MRNLQLLTDKVAIGLSAACAMHCLIFPLLVIWLPAFAVLPLADEAFHVWMVVVVIPTSIYALTLGCKQHKRYQLLSLGLLGLACLIVAIVFGELLLGAAGEKILTVIGALTLAIGHFKNYRLCRQQIECACPE